MELNFWNFEKFGFTGEKKFEILRNLVLIFCKIKRKLIKMKENNFKFRKTSIPWNFEKIGFKFLEN